MRTQGLSPKVWLPVAALLTTFVVNLIASGEFDRTELAQLVAAGMTAVLGALAGPGTVVPVADDVNADLAFASERGQYDPIGLLVLVIVIILIVVLVRALL